MKQEETLIGKFAKKLGLSATTGTKNEFLPKIGHRQMENTVSFKKEEPKTTAEFAVKMSKEDPFINTQPSDTTSFRAGMRRQPIF